MKRPLLTLIIFLATACQPAHSVTTTPVSTMTTQPEPTATATPPTSAATNAETPVIVPNR